MMSVGSRSRCMARPFRQQRRLFGDIEQFHFEIARTADSAGIGRARKQQAKCTFAGNFRVQRLKVVLLSAHGRNEEQGELRNGA